MPGMPPPIVRDAKPAPVQDTRSGAVRQVPPPKPAPAPAPPPAPPRADPSPPPSPPRSRSDSVAPLRVEATVITKTPSPDTDPALRVRPDTVDLEMDFFEEEASSIAEPPSVAPLLDPEARAVIATCEGELEIEGEPLRSARLHHEIARAYETSGFAAEASTHYEKALAGAPDYLPAIRGARRSRIAAKDFEGALAMFDAETQLAPGPQRKAMLLYQKGRLIEDSIGEVARAREVYVRALELDPNNASILKAIELCDRQGDRVALLATLDKTANAISEDARHRAIVLVERARLLESNPQPGATPAELYEAALKLDPHAFGALEALERIYRRDQQWRGLIGVLEREARQSSDDNRRALALYRLARIQGDRLGARAEAIAALDKAVDLQPNSRLTLDELARVQQEAGNFEAVAEVLAELINLAKDPREQVALLHRLAQLLERSLGHPDQAIDRYREALALDPSFQPSLQAVAPLLAARSQWATLVDVYLGSAAKDRDNARVADTFAKVAEIYEVHLRDPAKAANHHAQALSRVPGHAISFKALTRLYAQLDRYRDLIEVLERAVDQTPLPSLKVAHLFKISSTWEDSLGDAVQALHALTRILELDRNNLVAIHAMQRVAERAERYAQVIEAIEREIELVDNATVRVGLFLQAGNVLDEHLHDPEAALVRYRKALELEPQNLSVLAAIGGIYHRTNRWTDLLDIRARQAAATPAGPEAVTLMVAVGELCERELGDQEAALSWYQKAVAMDATYRPATAALVRLYQQRRDWAQLATTLQLETTRDDLAARATTWYRIGELREDWLDDPKGATTAYQQSLDAERHYRPATRAMVRVFEAQREWMHLIEALDRDAATTRDDAQIAAASMRKAEVYRDEVADDGFAVLCFEAVAEHDLGAMAALIALESLYTKTGAWTKLGGAYAQLAKKLADPGARVAVLRELVRLQENRTPVAARVHAAVYEQLLAIERDDELSLLAIEHLGRTYRDDRLLVGVYTRLAAITEGALTASFLTDLGRSLERLGDRAALDAYRTAVKKDPSIMTAIRGLARVADLRGDARAMAQAARLEADLTRRPEIAAKLFGRAGILRREQMNDLGAVDDFARALEVWPDDRDAAERIVQPLLDTGQVVRLIDVLTKAAQSARSSERKTALWLEIGSLYTRRFDNLGASITAFRRALEATPGHVPTLAKLADAYERNKSWGDAVATLEQLLAMSSDEAARAEAHLKLATIFEQHLDNVERASRSVEAVLRHDPRHTGALLRLADIQLRSGKQDDAVKTTQRLVDLADHPAQKGAALVRVARIERVRGDAAAADTALSEALALEGPGGDAERELKKAIASHGNWVGYAAGLATYVKRAADDGTDPARLAGAYLELAATYAEMKLGNKVIDILTDGVVRVPDDERLTLALVKRLREAGRLDEAIQHLKRASGRDPIQLESWRELAAVYGQANRRDDAHRVSTALAALGVSAGNRLAARPASAGDLKFDRAVMSSISVDTAHASPAATLLASIADTVGQIHVPSLDKYRLTPQDRIGPKSNYPLWDLAMRVGKIYGAELELYEHQAAEPMVAVEAFETPVLVVSQTLRRLTLGQQAFLLAYAIGPIAERLHPTMTLRPGDLETLLIGATRAFVPNFTPRTAITRDIEEAKELVKKHVPRKWRRQAELAATELAANPPADLGRWQASINHTSIRAALLVSDDLGATLEALHHVVEIPDSKGPDLIQTSPLARELVRFWISNRASSVRAHTGIVLAG